MPFIGQVFVKSNLGLTGIDLERKLYRLRRASEKTIGIYHPSLSSKTIVYKGMVTTLQLEPFFPELSDPRMVSKLAQMVLFQRALKRNLRKFMNNHTRLLLIQELQHCIQFYLHWELRMVMK
jgi:hypothetical protein